MSGESEDRRNTLHARLDQEMRDSVKEALKEWLDEKFAEVGKWTLRGIAAAALSALVYFMIHFGAWSK